MSQKTGRLYKPQSIFLQSCNKGQKHFILFLLVFFIQPFLFDLAVVLQGSLADVNCITAGLDFTHGEHNSSFTLCNQIFHIVFCSQT